VVCPCFTVSRSGGWDIEHEAEHYKERYGKDLGPILKQARELVAAGKGGQLIQPLDFIYCEQTAASAAAILGYYEPSQLRNSAELLPKIRVPVVVFIGSEDKVVTDLAEKVEPLVNGEQLRMEVLDGADHFFRDLYSEDIADVIAESFDL
jgi:pimeloyl-ACP methyl ester carboxylesterase